MKKKERIAMIQRFLIALAVLTVMGSMIFHTACKIESTNTVIRSVGINVAGLYRNGEARIVSQNTGAAITSLNVIQNGDRLDMVDNNGMIFRGTIGNAQGTSASFTVKGSTTAGAEAIISGTFTVSGNTSTMSGTWAEPSLFATVSASASVTPTPTPPPQTNNVGTNVNININNP